MAATVARVIIRKPLAIQVLALTRSAVCELSMDRSLIAPAITAAAT